MNANSTLAFISFKCLLNLINAHHMHLANYFILKILELFRKVVEHPSILLAVACVDFQLNLRYLYVSCAI